MTSEEINQVKELPYIQSKTEVEELFHTVFFFKNFHRNNQELLSREVRNEGDVVHNPKKNFPCLRIGTTSRIEGINVIIKTELNASSRLVELLLRTLKIHEYILNKNYSDGSHVRDLLLENLKDNSFLLSIKDKVSDYVYQQQQNFIIEYIHQNIKIFTSINLIYLLP